MPLFLFYRAVRLGMRSLWLHKTRSALTMLGVIFGVSSVIAMLAIGEGASYEAQQAIIRLGSTNIIIEAVKPAEEKELSSSGSNFVLQYGLKYVDLKRIIESVPGVLHVLPMRRILDEIQFVSRKSQCLVVGTLPDYPQVLGEPVFRGRFFTSVEEEQQVNVCVLSAGLAAKLFPFQNPLEEAVRVGANYYRVVGIVGEPHTVTVNQQKLPKPGEHTWQDEVFIPLSTSRALFGEVVARRTSGSFSAEEVQLHRVIVKTTGTAVVEAAANAIQTILQRFHEKKDYEVVVPLRLLRQSEETRRIFRIVLGSIAAISLLVGGIGIMNIMLATVTERTREIGIRRALGARKRDIINQFLVETVVMAVGGGILGVAIGFVIPEIVSHYTSIKTIVTPGSLLLAFCISVLIGLVFGIYPASRAANLDPIEALRHE